MVAAKSLHHFVVTIPRVVFHVEPIIDRDAFVRLLNMMIPKRWQVKHVAGVDSHFKDVCVGVVGELLKIWSEWINRNPVECDWLIVF